MNSTPSIFFQKRLLIGIHTHIYLSVVDPEDVLVSYSIDPLVRVLDNIVSWFEFLSVCTRQTYVQLIDLIIISVDNSRLYKEVKCTIFFLSSVFTKNKGQKALTPDVFTYTIFLHDLNN